MKLFIKNRQDKKIATIIENETGTSGLVFIAHGLAGNKEESQIQTYKNAFIKENFTVVRWDATNTIGESEGLVFKATITNYYQDLEDVINWSKNQSWYQEPFIIVGHSLGSACSIIFAKNYPDQVQAIAPTSAFISASSYFKWLGNEVMSSWKKLGFREEESLINPNLINKFSYKLAEDMKQYELMDHAKFITMPTLMICGEKDKITPKEIQQEFYDLIPSNQKEIHVIQGASHNLNSKEALKKIEVILENWIKKFKNIQSN